MVWLPNQSWKISLLVASGFRTPNVDDLAKVFESTAGRLIVPNANLKPEKTINYEVGISKTIAKKWKLGMAIWQTDFKNILTLDSSSFNGQTTINYAGTPSRVYTTVNKNKAYLWGVSGSLAGEFNPHIYFSSTAQYCYGQIIRAPQDNYPLDHIPPVFGKVSMEE